MSSLALGIGLGLFVGGQPGPVSLLCARSVLRGAFATGVAIGAGAAVIDSLYAALGLAGLATAFQLEPLRIALGAIGAVVLAAIGARTLWAAFRVRLGGEADEEVAGPRRAFLTALADHPEYAQTLLVEIIGAGPDAAHRRDEIMQRFADRLDADNAAAAERKLIARFASPYDAFAIVGAITELVSRQVRLGEPSDVLELAPVIDRLFDGVLRPANG